MNISVRVENTEETIRTKNGNSGKWDKWQQVSQEM